MGFVRKSCIKKILDNMHVIGSAKRNQVKELLEKPLSEYEMLYANSSVNDVYGYRTEKKLFGQMFTVVVAYNSDSRRKKEIKYAEKKKKILNGLEELKKKAEKEHGKGRKMTRKGLCTAANEVIPKDLRTVFLYEIPDNGKLSFDYGIDDTAEKDYMNSFGKSAIFTDLHELSSSDIVKTYFAKNIVEEDFKFLKDKLLLPVPPFFVRKDNRARVHVFLCVLGMIFSDIWQERSKNSV